MAILGPPNPPAFDGDCERCGKPGDLVACIATDGTLLARICGRCAREYADSGLDDIAVRIEICRACRRPYIHKGFNWDCCKECIKKNE